MSILQTPVRCDCCSLTGPKRCFDYNKTLIVHAGLTDPFLAVEPVMFLWVAQRCRSQMDWERLQFRIQQASASPVSTCWAAFKHLIAVSVLQPGAAWGNPCSGSTDFWAPEADGPGGVAAPWSIQNLGVYFFSGKRKESFITFSKGVHNPK